MAMSEAPMPAVPELLDPSRIKRDFPIFGRAGSAAGHGAGAGDKRPLVYLDSAASSQKPRVVLEAMDRYYRTTHANVHRGVYALAQEATAEFEGAREKVARFIGAPSSRGLVFTKNATEAINLVAQSWG